MSADVLVFGGHGMLGHIVRQVLQQRFEVLYSSRQPAQDAVTFDVQDSDTQLAVLLDQVKPNGVIINAVAMLADQVNHDVSQLGRNQSLAVNAVFPHRLELIAGDRGLRVIQISTDAVFGHTAGVVSESDAIGPEDFYGVTKAGGELTSSHCLTIRCSLIGPPAPKRNRGLWAWVMSERHRATVNGYVNQLWSGLTTYQLAETCTALVEASQFAGVRSLGPIHHLSPNKVVSKYDIVRALVQVLRPDLTVEPAHADKAICRVLVSRYMGLDLITPHYSDWPAAVTAAAQWSRKSTLGTN